MAFRRLGHVLVVALGAAGVCTWAGCSGSVTNEPQRTTSGSKSGAASPNVPSSSSGGQPSPEGGAPDCASIPVPQTAYVCPSGTTITGTYVANNGACVLVYNCPPPAAGSAPDASTVPVGDAGGGGGGGLCANGIGPCASGSSGGTIGPTYPCGDAGLTCTCSSADLPPAPCNAAGQQLTYALSPPPGPVTPYSSMSEFDAIAVGRWWRTAGEAEMECEELGIEITAQETWMPLVRASDGLVQGVQNLAQPIGLTFANGTPSIPGNNAPVFYDACSGPGTGMELLIDPWYADYVKMQ